MRGNENFRKIRIFLSSPGDVREERTCVKTVVEKLNQTGSLPDKKNLVLEVLDWNSHVRPGMGRPQEVILNQLPIEKWDLFVGIIWARFGTKSGGYNKKTG
jgi:hypothetical protein